MNWPTAFVLLALMTFRAAILGVTAYAVFWLGYSGWWFLLAIILCSGSDAAEEKAKGRE